jgi:hypothetical protein
MAQGGLTRQRHKVFVSDKPMVLTALTLRSLKVRETLGETRGGGDDGWSTLVAVLGELEGKRGNDSFSVTKDGEEAPASTWAVVDVKVRNCPRSHELVVENEEEEEEEQYEEPEIDRLLS